MIKRLLFFIPFLMSACVNIPKNVSPVTGFDINRYLGTWYEIARLDHSFERGLERVTAKYSDRDDGGIKVINKGFDSKKNRWKETIGKAYFIDDSSIGRLKVSFWGPFYGAYHHSGQPYASLIAFEGKEDLKEIFFVTPRTTRKFSNLSADSRVAILINSSLNMDSDFHEAVSITALGNAKEINGAEKDDILGLYLTKHPYLEAFATSPTCALVKVTIKHMLW